MVCFRPGLGAGPAHFCPQDPGTHEEFPLPVPLTIAMCQDCIKDAIAGTKALARFNVAVLNMICCFGVSCETVACEWCQFVESVLLVDLKLASKIALTRSRNLESILPAPPPSHTNRHIGLDTQAFLEAAGVYRTSLPVSSALGHMQVLPNPEHNVQLMRATWPKEAMDQVEWPEGTVVWFKDSTFSEYKAFLVDRPEAMTNQNLLMEGATATWYIQAGCRFYMQVFRNANGDLEVFIRKTNLHCQCCLSTLPSPHSPQCKHAGLMQRQR